MTYQEHGSRNLDLAFWTKDRDHVGGSLFIREADTRIGLRFNVTDENALFTQ